MRKTIWFAFVTLGLMACSSGSSGGSSSGTSGSSGSSSATSGTSGSSSSGSSTTSTGSTGSSTGGSTGSSGSCIPSPSDGGPSPYLGAYCADAGDCCGLNCVAESSEGICEPSCVTSDDCPSAYTGCVDGSCAVKFCGGAAGGAFNAACELGDGGGDCVAPPGGPTVEMLDGGYVGICMLSGVAATGASCDPNALRTEPEKRCVAGDVCTFSSGGDPICAQNCDASQADAGCPSGTRCQPYWEGGDQFTACL